MSRRSTPQRTIDDTAFPIRLKVRVPSNGVGSFLTDMHLWLTSEVGPGEFAHYSGGALGGGVTALYFRRPEDLVRFLEAFPMLELADGTTSRGYTSPLFPNRRPRA
jgi:hypothetical protein